MSYEVRISILICGRSGRRGDSADRWWGMLMGGSPGRWPPRRGYLLHYRAVSCQPSRCSNGASSTFRVITGAETCAGGGRDRRQCREDQVAAAPREGLTGQLGEGRPGACGLSRLPGESGCPVPGQLGLVKQGVGLDRGEVVWWPGKGEGKQTAQRQQKSEIQPVSCSSDLC